MDLQQSSNPYCSMEIPYASVAVRLAEPYASGRFRALLQVNGIKLCLDTLQGSVMGGKRKMAKSNDTKTIGNSSVNMAETSNGSLNAADLMNGVSNACQLNGHKDSDDSTPNDDQSVSMPGGDTVLATFVSGDTPTAGDSVNPEHPNRSQTAEAMLADGEKPISLKLSAPGADLLEVQVVRIERPFKYSSEPRYMQMGFNELVQELQQILMDGDDTCHRTCFAFKFGDKYLNNYMEIRHIEGLVDGSVLKVVEEPYTLRQARIHVRHVRDLLRVPNGSDCFLGSEGISPTYVDKILDFLPNERKRVGKGQIDCTPPDFIMPNSEMRPMTALYNFAIEKPVRCIKLMTLTCWNPPPGPRKLKGDILYLFVLTLENKGFHITCCPRGFYVNMSTDDTFNPTPVNPHMVCHSLIDLLLQYDGSNCQVTLPCRYATTISGQMEFFVNRIPEI
ncbi:Clustered mitochondria protein homolog [Trichuris trichiura]|uniref:Clustered mitochondria protein homolog n=1 Tax=Trichuris trichiura TaxID=36087 RepID=A0A077ZM34_TRITR|nr:Clustered mitochondria protein homolog [Trichuris trichiura]